LPFQTISGAIFGPLTVDGPSAARSPFDLVLDGSAHSAEPFC
jgi:hypothetical protein